MVIFTDKYGFVSDDLDAVTEELARILDMIPEAHFNEGRGGDYWVFRENDTPDGRLVVYLNHSLDVDGPIIQEDDFLELGVILLIEQRDEYVDYELKLRGMNKYEPILLYRSKYPPDAGQPRVLFDLAKERPKSSG